VSNLPLLSTLGIIAIIVACFVHGRVDTTLPRAKFVFLSLTGVGSLPLGYAALWVLADQQPLDFSLAPFVTFGLTLWVSALTYSVLYILLQKDTAPSY
jgi:hypothetical protein